MTRLHFLAGHILIAGLTHAQTGVTNPISEACGPSVVCINRYANVLP
jgi:hypothetical protein